MPERKLVPKLIRRPQTEFVVGAGITTNRGRTGSLGYRTPSEFAELAENASSGTIHC